MKHNESYPMFFNTKEFAEIWGVTPIHVRHAAKNYTDPDGNKCRAKLPPGWAAAMWGDVWVIFQEHDKDKIADLFNLDLGRKEMVGAS